MADRRADPGAREHLQAGRARPRGGTARGRGHPARVGTGQRLPASVLRRHAAAGDDRDGAVLQPGPADRGRAHDRAGRDDPGADPQADQESEGRIRHRGRADHPRHGRGGRHRGPGGRDVRGEGGRAGQPAQPVLRRPAPVHLGPARVHRPAGPAQAAAALRDPGHAAVADQPARGLRVRAALPAPIRPVRRGRRRCPTRSATATWTPASSSQPRRSGCATRPSGRTWPAPQDLAATGEAQ